MLGIEGHSFLVIFIQFHIIARPSSKINTFLKIFRIIFPESGLTQGIRRGKMKKMTQEVL